jgi:hypothetical protein
MLHMASKIEVLRTLLKVLKMSVVECMGQREMVDISPLAFDLPYWCIAPFTYPVLIGGEVET